MEGSNGSPATSTFMQEVYRGPSDRGKEHSHAGFRKAVILSERATISCGTGAKSVEVDVLGQHCTGHHGRNRTASHYQYPVRLDGMEEPVDAKALQPDRDSGRNGE
jgi:hypothetical protein